LQVYAHSIVNISGLARPVDPAQLVVVGVDALNTNERNLALFFSADEMRAGIIYSSRFSWQAESDTLFIAFFMTVIIAFFIGRPLVVELDSAEQRRILVYLNVLGSSTVIGFMFYRIVDIHEGIERSTGVDRISVDMLMGLTVGVTMVQYFLCLYANLALRAVSPQRNAIIRLMFSSILCTVFVMHTCGATERDVQVRPQKQTDCGLLIPSRQTGTVCSSRGVGVAAHYRPHADVAIHCLRHSMGRWLGSLPANSSAALYRELRTDYGGRQSQRRQRFQQRAGSRNCCSCHRLWHVCRVSRGRRISDRECKAQIVRDKANLMLRVCIARL
jgi:hypothetical protein